MFCRSEPLDSHATPLMRRALDLLPDGVLIIGSSRDVLYLNAAFQRLWRIPNDVVRDGDGAMLEFVMDQLVDPKGFVATVASLYRSPDSSEDQISFKDGRVFNRRSVALDAGNGGSARIWIFSDITEAQSARIDPLTGLPNRRAYIRELPEFLASDAKGLVKTFALLDFDLFKSYNDLYGHSAGDDALGILSHLLQSRLKESGDKVYRIGGEEFAITSFHNHRECAHHFHEGMLQSVEQADIIHAGSSHGVVTVSMGMCFIQGKAALKNVFREADTALYRAKRLGRNRIVTVEINGCFKSRDAFLTAQQAPLLVAGGPRS